MMYEMKKELGEKLKMKRSTFYSRVLKENGFVFRKGKIRHGKTNDEQKQLPRYFNGLLIQRLSFTHSQLFFFDETVINLGTFGRRYWWRKGEAKKVNLTRPSLFWRIIMLVKNDRIVAFELCDGDHRNEDVTRFLRSSMIQVREQNPSSDLPIVVLDNGSKNRSRNIRRLANSGLFILCYTTPTSPEQNFIERVFGAIKWRFARIATLDAINDSNFPNLVLARSIFLTIREVSEKDFPNCWSAFLAELDQHINSLNVNL